MELRQLLSGCLITDDTKPYTAAPLTYSAWKVVLSYIWAEDDAADRTLDRRNLYRIASVNRALRYLCERLRFWDGSAAHRMVHNALKRGFGPGVPRLTAEDERAAEAFVQCVRGYGDAGAAAAALRPDVPLFRMSQFVPSHAVLAGGAGWGTSESTIPDRIHELREVGWLDPKTEPIVAYSVSLGITARGSRPGFIKGLVEMGSDVNKGNTSIGWNAMHHACSTADDKCLRELLECGADPYAKTNRAGNVYGGGHNYPAGTTPLDVLRVLDITTCCQVLAEFGVDICAEVHY